MVGNALSFDGLAYAAMATGGLALLLALFVGFLMIKGAPVDRKCNELEDAYKPIEKEIRRDSSFAEEMEGETPGMREDSTAAAALAEKELEVRRGLELIARYAAAPTVDALEARVDPAPHPPDRAPRQTRPPPPPAPPFPPPPPPPPPTSQGGGAPRLRPLGHVAPRRLLDRRHRGDGEDGFPRRLQHAPRRHRGVDLDRRGARGDAVGPEASGPFGLAEGSVPESFATEEESVAAMLRTASAMPAASSSSAAEADEPLAEDSLAELQRTMTASGRSSTASGARSLSIKHEDPAQNEEFEDDDDFVAALARCAPARPSAAPRHPADARLRSLAGRTARSARRVSSPDVDNLNLSIEKLEAKGSAPQSTAPRDRVDPASPS